MSSSNVWGDVYVPANVMRLEKRAIVFTVIITHSACNDKRQEFTQPLHLKPESVCGSHFASRLRQV